MKLTIDSEPVRVVYVAILAVLTALAALGVTDVDLPGLLAQYGVVIVGGETARAKVTPERKRR